MLLLDRKVRESIVIADDIIVKVIHIDPTTRTVRLGIEAPKSVVVNRGEIHEQLKSVIPS